MSRPSTLTFIVPDVRVRPDDLTAGDALWPQLARLAGRGRVRRLDASIAPALQPWQRMLLRAVSLDEAAPRHASAPLCRHGSAQTPSRGFWLHAEPVHLAAGLDRLNLISLAGETRITEAERMLLWSTVGEHLATRDFTLHESGTSSWLIDSAKPLAVETVCPEAAFDDLDAALPRGADAASLRLLMTELQMLLHEHPVNIARADRELPSVNSLWFWGGGSLEEVTPMMLPAGFGDHPYLRGLYRLYGSTCNATPADATELLQHLPPRASAVCVAQADAMDFVESRWLGPLARALLAGRFDRLDIVFGEWEVSVNRLAMLRFWRRPSPPGQWVA